MIVGYIAEMAAAQDRAGPSIGPRYVAAEIGKAFVENQHKLAIKQEDSF